MADSSRGSDAAVKRLDALLKRNVDTPLDDESRRLDGDL
jgi:hypothetical protein